MVTNQPERIDHKSNRLPGGVSSHRHKAFRQITSIQGVMLVAYAILAAWYGITTSSSQHFFLAACLLIAALISLAVGRTSRRHHTGLVIALNLAGIYLLAISVVSIVENAAWISLFLLWLYALLYSSLVIPPRKTYWAILATIITGVICILVDITSPLQTIDPLTVIIPALISLAILGLAFGILLIRRFFACPLQIKVVTGFLLAALIPLAGFLSWGWVVNQTFLSSLNRVISITSEQTLSIMGHGTASLAAILGIGMAAAVSIPAKRMAHAVSQMASGGTHTSLAVETNDDLAELADSIHGLTVHLSDRLHAAEAAFEALSIDLNKRADQVNDRVVQIQTIGEVARAVGIVQRVEDLLPTLCTTIAERLGLQRVSIFDRIADPPQIRVWSSYLDSSGHYRLTHEILEKLPNNIESIQANGKADREADALPVGDTPVNEIVLPLRCGAGNNGAVQMTMQAGTMPSEEDYRLFHILADQIAVGIECSRLASSSQTALEEVQHLYRKYLHNEWTSFLVEQGVYEYHFRHPSYDSMPLDHAHHYHLSAGRTPSVPDQVEQPADGKPHGTALAVPILLRGEPIGAIDLHASVAGQAWNEDDVYIVQKTASNLALILENARLVDKTLRRLDRERKVVEITGKIRASPNPQTMLQTALDELRKAFGQSLNQPGQADESIPE